MSDTDCTFCRITAGELPASIIAESERSIAFLDINPATEGHTLVIPKVHAKDLLTVDSEDLVDTTKLAAEIAKRQVGQLGAEGVNLLNACGHKAWQTVFHFHLHVIPRYSEDRLRLPWNPAERIDVDHKSIAEQLRA